MNQSNNLNLNLSKRGLLKSPNAKRVVAPSMVTINTIVDDYLTHKTLQSQNSEENLSMER